MLAEVARFEKAPFYAEVLGGAIQYSWVDR